MTRTTANSFELASGPPVAGDDPVNGNDPSGELATLGTACPDDELAPTSPAYVSDAWQYCAYNQSTESAMVTQSNPHLSAATIAGLPEFIDAGSTWSCTTANGSDQCWVYVPILVLIQGGDLPASYDNNAVQWIIYTNLYRPNETLGCPFSNGRYLSFQDFQNCYAVGGIEAPDQTLQFLEVAQYQGAIDLAERLDNVGHLTSVTTGSCDESPTATETV